MKNVPLAMALLLFWVLPVQAQESKGIALELNSVNTTEGKCRITLMVRNGLDTPVDSLSLDLVVFDKTGGVAGYSGVDLGSLPPAKTRVRQYDIAQSPCAEISQLLVNEIRSCGEGLAETECLKRLSTRSRTEIELNF